MTVERAPSLLWELFTAYQRTGQLIRAALAETETPADDYAIYSRLATHGPATPTELARDLGVPRSTLMLRFGRLVERGHASQVPNPVDGRSSLLTLTSAGRSAQEAALPHFRSVMVAVDAELELPRDEVARTLAELARAADAALERRDTNKRREARLLAVAEAKR